MRHLQDAIAAIDRQIEELQDAKRILMGSIGGYTPAPVRPIGGRVADAAPRPKRQMSDEARQRIREATQRRWSAFRDQQAAEAAAPAATDKPNRRSKNSKTEPTDAPVA